MPRTTLTAWRSPPARPAAGRARRGSADAVEHSLRLGLGRAARRREHLAQEVARAVLVADALELLGELELARQRVAASVAVVGEAARRRARILGNRHRLVEIERDAGEIEGQRLVA